MKIRKMAIIAATASCMSLLAGCATQKETMLKEGYPLSYADGFDDGCHSGNQAGGSLFDQFKKDIGRFDNDKDYAQGWSDGFRQCETKQEAIQRQTRMAVENQRLIEARKQSSWEEQRHLEREVMKNVDVESLKYLK
jgi:hypothetical protein